MASEVKSSAEALQTLREKVDTELWKGVLKAEASLVDKERSLNEVQAKREQLWGERESIMAAMRADLGAEQQRATRAWEESWSRWEGVHKEHDALRTELHERRVKAEAAQVGMAQEMASANASLKAEISMLTQVYPTFLLPTSYTLPPCY